MPLKLEPAEEPSLNLTPMIDVVLQLVIFFLVSTEFATDANKERQYEIDLPQVTDARPLTNLPDELVVNISRDGAMSLGREPRTIEQLEADLADAAARFAEQSVLIRGAYDGPYQHVMTVLNACHRAGITNVQLANEVGSGRSP
jgi:biopolymer transport protein ExbD